MRQAPSTESKFIGLPGQYFDAETGLHYNYQRIYSPDNGRYLESDRIGINGGLNTYIYALNNPIVRFDPFGLESRWFGTFDIKTFSEAFGGGTFATFQLESECGVDGLSWKVEIEAKIPTFSYPLRITGARGEITFVDNINDTPYPYTFNGEAKFIGAGVVVWSLDTLSIGRIVLGNAIEEPFSRDSTGIDFGASLGIFGTSRVITAREKNCCK